MGLMKEPLLLCIQAFLTGNFLLSIGLGMGRVPEGPKNLRTALGEGLSAIAVTAGTGVMAVLVDEYGLRVWGIPHLELGIFLLIGYLVLRGVARFSPFIFRESLVSLALAVAVLARDSRMGPAEALGYGLGVGAGVALVWMLVAGLMGRVELSLAPKSLQPVPIFFVLLGLVSLAFGGFQMVRP